MRQKRPVCKAGYGEHLTQRKRHDAESQAPYGREGGVLLGEMSMVELRLFFI